MVLIRVKIRGNRIRDNELVPPAFDIVAPCSVFIEVDVLNKASNNRTVFESINLIRAMSPILLNTNEDARTGPLLVCTVALTRTNDKINSINGLLWWDAAVSNMAKPVGVPLFSAN